MNTQGEALQRERQADSDYLAMLDFLAELIEARAKTSISKAEAYRDDAQVLAIKMFKHLFSARQLFDGAQYHFHDGRSFELVDHSSVQALVRAAMESYFVFHYLFGNSDENVNRFRHACWRCAGLVDRQNYATSTKESKEQIASELPDLEAVRQLIKSNTQFDRYSVKEKAQLLAGNWKVRKEETSWKACATSAGMESKYFDDIYGYLSGAAHSSYAALLQIRASQQEVVLQRSLAGTAMRMANILLGMLIRDLRQYLAIAEDVLPNDTVNDAMRRWDLFNKYLHEHYGKPLAGDASDARSSEFPSAGS